MQPTEITARLLAKPLEDFFGKDVVALANSMEKSWRIESPRWSTSDSQTRVSASLAARSAYSTYSPHVIFEAIDHDIRFHTQCTCRGDRCEHAYLLLKLVVKSAQARKQFDGDLFKNWLQRFRSEATGRPASDNATIDLVAVVGVPSDQKKAAGLPLLVTPMIRATGTAGSLQPMSEAFASQLISAAIETLGMLSSTAFDPPPRQAGPSFYVRHALQESALNKLLDDQSVFLSARDIEPLKRGAPIKPSFGWQVGEGGSQSLEARLPSGLPFQLVALGHTCWYIDVERRRLGPIQCDMQVFQSVLRAPIVRREHSASLAAAWKSFDAPKDIPAPHDLDSTSAVSVTATPLLTTRMVPLRLEDGRRHDVPVITLAYTYAGTVFTESDFDRLGNAERIIEGLAVRITPDPVAQARTRELLCQLGFRGRSQGSYLALLTSGDYLFADDPLNRGRVWNGMQALASAGIQVEQRSALAPRKLSANAAYGRLVHRESQSNWFDLELQLDIGGAKQPLEPILLALLSDPLFSPGIEPGTPWAVTLETGELVTLPVDLLRSIMAPISDWLLRRRDNPDEDRPLSVTEAAVMAERLGGVIDGRTLKYLREAIRKLNASASDALPPPPPTLAETTLRPYQLVGLRWLNGLATASMEAQSGIGGVLADDMGLGKTIQMIAHILWLAEQDWLFAPVLIVVPNSLVGNWVTELAQRGPSLKRLVLDGPRKERAEKFREMPFVQVVITTYDYLIRDIKDLQLQPFALVVTDEGQRVKNIRTASARALRQLAKFRIVDITGTAVENNLLELFAHIDLAVPNLLGDEKEFTRFYRTPIEKRGDAARLTELRQKIAPFILRRTKAEVEPDLPPKTEIVQYLQMDTDQAALYESVRVTVSKKVRKAIAERGLAQSNVVILEALQKLRQACCDPRLLKMKTATNQSISSVKLDELFALIETGVSDGRRILVFSTYAQMIHLIASEAQVRGIDYLMLTGDTKDRTGTVERFQSGKYPLFLLTLKAGGVGLNLTAADWVIHYDPWWNPQAENQATDRAHRIGQTKPVFVYRLLCRGTVEEKMGVMKARKSALADAVLSAEDGVLPANLAFTQEDVDELIG